MYEAYHEERTTLDLQLSWVRALLASPYQPKGKQTSVDKFVIFRETADTIKRGQQQSPDEMLNYVQSVLHPYFEARALIEATLPNEEIR